MTLRGRLTTAFLVVVLGPVLLGAIFVGVTVTSVGRDRADERLDHAATTVRTAVGALCRQLQAAADSVAVLSDETARRAAADQLVQRGLASAVSIADPSGAPIIETPSPPPRPWRDCAEPVVGGADGAIDAVADIRDPVGNSLGTVYAAQRLDAALIDRLAGVGGAAVTLLRADGGASFSTEPAGRRAAVAALGAQLRENETDRSGSRYVRRIASGPGQPLIVVVSTPGGHPRTLYVLLAVAVASTAALAMLVASWLARSTTRPLDEVARAADQVADGDLDTRVPMVRQDEVGRLAGSFNRMTRELQSYVQALTASRDQLRRHLSILGDTLSSTHDLQRILRVIVETAMAATGARAGVVLLVDPVTRQLVGRAEDGLTGLWPGDDVATLRLAIGSGLLGNVAETAEPRLGRSGDGTVPAPGEPWGRSYVAVPICAPAVPAYAVVPAGPGEDEDAGPVTLGVLALYDRLGADDFDDGDLETLRTFAGQAGVAVNNVRLHEEAQRLSLTDPLTGLWNYRYLQECCRREVERASRFGRMLCVLALDLDHFKDVNDTYGHAAGDAVLIEFARRIKGCLREVDLAFRQGGEEFVVLLPETDAYGGATVAERLGADIRATPVPIGGRRPGHPDRIPISVSIGIAVYPDHGLTAAQVLDAADAALYAAKAGGRDTYRLADIAPPDGPQPAPDGAVLWTGGSPPSGGNGAPGGSHPPRQSRGR